MTGNNAYDTHEDKRSNGHGSDMRQAGRSIQHAHWALRNYTFRFFDVEDEAAFFVEPPFGVDAREPSSS